MYLFHICKQTVANFFLFLKCKQTAENLDKPRADSIYANGT